MKDRYRRVSFLSDIEAMKNAIGEMRGMFFPSQPALNPYGRTDAEKPLPDESWFEEAFSSERTHTFPHTCNFKKSPGFLSEKSQ